MADETLSNIPSKSNKEELAAMELEAKKLELAAKRLEIEERTANLQDVQERLSDRQLKREDRQQSFQTKGQAIAQTNASEKAQQAACPHRKGGFGQNGNLGRGQDSQYAVIKHKMGNGDIWVRCLRCAKTWKPPLEKNYKTNEAYLEAFVEYKTAVNFTTLNSDSGSAQFRFSDGGKHYREVTDSASLR